MLFKMPDGTVSPPKDFLSNDIQYGQEIFYHWTLPQLKEIGIKPYREDNVPYGYDSGAALEVETETEWIKTYPNPIPNISRVKNDIYEKIKTVRKSYEEKGFIQMGI